MDTKNEKVRGVLESVRRADGGAPRLYRSQFVGLDDRSSPAKCLLCEETFVLPANDEGFLKHLFQEHRFVIGDIENIACLRSYVHYWGTKFAKEPFSSFCTTLTMDCTANGGSRQKQSYFLLSDCIREDKILRSELHRAKLEQLLAKQYEEKLETNYKRGCMFCRMEFCGSRADYVDHLSQKHNFYLGKREDLVFVDELLDKIQSNFDNLICTYCGKIFKNRTVLKEHMRKKFHKSVNPNDATYDRFYINNYLEPGVSWRKRKSNCNNRGNAVCSNSESEEDDGDAAAAASWSDWKGESIDVTCLFCTFSDRHLGNVLCHQKAEHGFDFESVTKNFTFYQKVKVVNYIRKQMQSRQCIFCDADARDDVLRHMGQENHCRIPDQSVWDQPEFYFPPNEDDSFLYSLDTDDDDDDDGGGGGGGGSDGSDEKNDHHGGDVAKLAADMLVTC